MRHYHVVCYECTFEELTTTNAAAQINKMGHEYQSGHDVVAGRIE